MWIVHDWTGKNLFPERQFSTFEDGWEFVRSQFPAEKDWEEIYVIKTNEPRQNA